MSFSLPEKVSDPESQTSTHSDLTAIDNREAEDEVVPPGEPVDSTTKQDTYYEVIWESHEDPRNPKNFSNLKKWYLTTLGGILVLNATFASSAPSGVLPQMMEYFHFGSEVATLTIAIFVAGYTVGPLVFGPLSEQYGRRPVFLFSFIAYTGFQIGCALSKNTASILVFRFLGGTFASSPLTNSGGLIADIWGPRERGLALSVFTLAPFAGPSLGPLVGGYIGVTGTSWRVLFWVLTAFAGVCTLGVYFTLPETFAPIILAQIAQKKRKETGDDRWYAAIEAQSVHWKVRISNILARPFKILFSETILLLITAYLSFVYGCVYLLFEAFPIVYGPKGHDFSAGILGLMYMPIFFGGLIGVLLAVFYYNPKYEKLVDQYAPKPVPPEARLPMAGVGGIAFAISFFWFGFTSYKSVIWVAPMLSAGATGFGVVLIFLSLFNFILDAYLPVAASALAATTICRSVFGASFPMFATQMYDTLNPRWASFLLGCISVLMAPIPFLFIRYGDRLRRKSKYAPS